MSQDTYKTHKIVREAYAAVATNAFSGCCASASTEISDVTGCCATSAKREEFSSRFGYSAEEINTVPNDSNLGLGCGNPQAIAALKVGEVVVDLGAGAGFDCFLAARQVGPKGHVIGIDMTHEMLSKARENAKKLNINHIEFRLGEIEYLPIPDKTADVVISNCVINLSPNKEQVFREAFRILKPGGRVAISDVVRTAEFPKNILDDSNMLCGCVTGALSTIELKTCMVEAGFTDIHINIKEESREVIKDWAPDKNVQNYIVSANIKAVKPNKTKS